MHKALVNHIHSGLEKGEDIRDIRTRLLSAGYAEHEIHAAIDYVLMELHKLENAHEVREVEHFYEPSPVKLVLPLAVLLILAVHFFVNVNYLPVLGEKLCRAVQVESSPFVESPGIPVESLSVSLSLAEDYNLLLMANVPVIVSRVYQLSPMFPLPCELAPFTEGVGGCSYYIAREDYDCVQDGITRFPGSPVSRFFSGSIPPYQEISLSRIVLSSVVLLLISYLINCTVVFSYQKVAHHKGKRKALELVIAIALVLCTALVVFGYIYALRIVTG